MTKQSRIFNHREHRGHRERHKVFFPLCRHTPIYSANSGRILTTELAELRGVFYGRHAVVERHPVNQSEHISLFK